MWTVFAVLAVLTILAVVALRPRGTRRPLDAGVALGPLRTLRPRIPVGRSLRPLNARRPLRTVFAVLPILPVLAVVALRPSGARIALRPRCAWGTLGTDA